MEVVPNVTYQFQAEAWEEIGIVGRVDCNKSPPVHQGPNRARLQVSARAVQYLQSLGLAKKGKIEAMMRRAKAGDKDGLMLTKVLPLSYIPIIAVYDFERMYKYSNIVQTFFQQTNRIFNGIARISPQYDVKVTKAKNVRIFYYFWIFPPQKYGLKLLNSTFWFLPAAIGRQVYETLLVVGLGNNNFREGVPLYSEIIVEDEPPCVFVSLSKQGHTPF